MAAKRTLFDFEAFDARIAAVLAASDALQSAQANARKKV